jgi:hypothetical protein
MALPQDPADSGAQIDLQVDGHGLLLRRGAISRRRFFVSETLNFMIDEQYL